MWLSAGGFGASTQHTLCLSLSSGGLLGKTIGLNARGLIFYICRCPHMQISIWQNNKLTGNSLFPKSLSLYIFSIHFSFVFVLKITSEPMETFALVKKKKIQKCIPQCCGLRPSFKPVNRFNQSSLEVVPRATVKLSVRKHVPCITMFPQSMRCLQPLWKQNIKCGPVAHSLWLPHHPHDLQHGLQKRQEPS